MSWFYNLKLTSKLIAAFSAVLALTVILGVFAIAQLSTVNEQSTIIATNWMPAANAVGRFATRLNEFRTRELQHMVANTPEEMGVLETKADKTLAGMKEAYAALDGLCASPEERKLIDEMERQLEAYLETNGQLFELSRSGKRAEAKELLLGKSLEQFRKIRAAVEDELQFQVDGSRKANETADALYASGRMWVIGILLACVALGMTLAICIARIVTNPVKQLSAIAESIAAGDMEQQINIHTKEEMGALAGSFRQLQDAVKNLIVETKSVAQAAQSGDLKKRGDASNFQGAYRDLLTGFNETLDAVLEPINEAADVLDKVADRDLTVRVTGDYQGDHAKIKDALNTAIENLEEALGQAAVGAEQVSAAATQISNGSQALAQGASEQASSLEEISSSLEEMASMTKQNAENSNQGKALAAQSQESAERGDEAMKRMADAIGKIKSSSDATAKIVKTIDEIAFQTNLLALNAAVEAARAGEAGKGFAVVAEEVRNLAQRSAEAAKDTANMIEESVANAEGGVQITNEVASLLSEIADGARKVNDLVAEIAVASKEQSTGIEQVNLAVTQLDKVTQQNAANSEESASAAEELNSQSVTLSQTVQQFKIGVTEAKSAANAPAAKPQAKEAPTVSSPKKNGAAPKRELVGAGTNGHARNGKANRILPLDEGDFAGF